MSKTTKKPSAAVLHQQRAQRLEEASASLMRAAGNFSMAPGPEDRDYWGRKLHAAAREYAAAVRALAGVKS